MTYGNTGGGVLVGRVTGRGDGVQAGWTWWLSYTILVSGPLTSRTCPS
jgi:hypothetical protein